MTFLVTWQPARRGGFDNYEDTTAATTGREPRTVRERWSTGSRRHVELGERVYLLRQGTDRPGIVASGTVATLPTKGPHWDPDEAALGKTGWYSDIDWDRVVGPDDAIPLEVLETAVPAFNWHPRGGGAGLDDDQAAIVAGLWDGSRPFNAHGERARGIAAEATQDATTLLRRLLGVWLPGRAGPGAYQVRAVDPPGVTVATGPTRLERRLDITEVHHALAELRHGGFETAEAHGWRAGFLAAVLCTLPGVRAIGEPPLLTLGRPRADLDQVDEVDDQTLPFDGPLSRPAAGSTRVEQSALRARLFGTATHGNCALCGRRYPVEFLRAAHIKRRSLCSEAEKRDLPNIAMPACVFGCDALFEAGHLAVDHTGTVVGNHHDDDLETRTSSDTSAMHDYLTTVAGSTCSAFTRDSADYFAWHHHNIFRA